MRTRRAMLIGSAGVLATLPFGNVFAAQFMTIEQAQHALFPAADRFEEHPLALDVKQLAAVSKLAGQQPRHGRLRTWRVLNGTSMLGHFFVDEVIGRQDLITYAAAVDQYGKLGPLEVLTYRESHGGEIRNAAWCGQFKGRDLSNLRFRTDIKNIAGATLSSEHVTQGARWLLALWQVALSASAGEHT